MHPASMLRIIVVLAPPLLESIPLPALESAIPYTAPGAHHGRPPDQRCRVHRARARTAFMPPDVGLRALRRAIPNDSEAFHRSMQHALAGIVPVIAATVLLGMFGWRIDGLAVWAALYVHRQGTDVLRWALRGVYWNAEGLVWAGLWAVGELRARTAPPYVRTLTSSPRV